MPLAVGSVFLRDPWRNKISNLHPISSDTFGSGCQNRFGISFLGFWCTTHFRTHFSGWIGMFTGGTIWLLTHGHFRQGSRVHDPHPTVETMQQAMRCHCPLRQTPVVALRKKLSGHSKAPSLSYSARRVRGYFLLEGICSHLSLMLSQDS